MGDFIKSNPFTASVVFLIILIFIFSITVAKPYIDNSDMEIYKFVKSDYINYMDSLNSNLDSLKSIASKQLEEIRKIEK